MSAIENHHATDTTDDTAAYEQGYQDGAMAKDAEIEGLRERLAELVELLRSNPNAYAYELLEIWQGGKR